MTRTMTLTRDFPFPQDRVWPADMATITGHFWHGSTALALTLIIALHIAGAVKDHETITRMV